MPKHKKPYLETKWFGVQMNVYREPCHIYSCSELVISTLVFIHCCKNELLYQEMNMPMQQLLEFKKLNQTGISFLAERYLFLL